ncbi:bifunctional methylenetetrahydrofolate dehydrogenase/methenyltetrahydrofolate cyclohydrolase FolD [Fodinisporobacter ferrooxydans]|uniref:Bifunctional protein FolD n=1 Tax=Fodinisporobacter ferrooxydans TaxID=2901836 RepID=A0ABY4CJI0_9BACL|nr:bifunctional methylenetetrahydrofolate dehydrogenase/methenyltetrahydrofolate cyclohydrolase FolD [Alicyclobacillaceae bacterium MYW30-H2]
MNAVVLNGKHVAAELQQQLKHDVEKLKLQNITPGLAVLLIGDDPASHTYVRAKEKAAAEVGIYSVVFRMPETVTQQQVIDRIQQLNQDDSIHGILVQLPLPKHIDVRTVIDAIDPEKDVDGFHPVNIGNMQLGKDAFLPCTPFGVLHLLKQYNIDLQGKNTVIVGHSHIVGRPLATLLLNENATVSVCHAYTKNLKEMTRMADILIVAVGKKHLITADMVKPGAVVIDVGINREKNRIYGDCDFDEIQSVASYITPVPGGVGPMTISMLLYNTVAAARRQADRLVTV